MSHTLDPLYHKRQRQIAREAEESLDQQITRGIAAVKKRFGSRVAITRIHDSVNIDFRGNGRPPTPEEVAEVETLMHFGKIPSSPLDFPSPVP